MSDEELLKEGYEAMAEENLELANLFFELQREAILLSDESQTKCSNIIGQTANYDFLMAPEYIERDR